MGDRDKLHTQIADDSFVSTCSGWWCDVWVVPCACRQLSELLAERIGLQKAPQEEEVEEDTQQEQERWVLQRKEPEEEEE